MAALKERYPLVTFSFSFELFGQTLTPETTELSLQGQTFTTPEEVSEGLKNLPNLTKCDMRHGTDQRADGSTANGVSRRNICVVCSDGAWQVRIRILSRSPPKSQNLPDGAGTYIASAGNSELVDADLAALQYCKDLVYLDLTATRLPICRF